MPVIEIFKNGGFDNNISIKTAKILTPAGVECVMSVENSGSSIAKITFYKRMPPDKNALAVKQLADMLFE